MTDRPRHSPNVSQLRDDIDSGRTGDKIAASDPAAAPLGTDDEAGGTPPDPQRVAAAQAQERAQGEAAEKPDALQGGRSWVTPAIVFGACLILIVALVALFTSS